MKTAKRLSTHQKRVLAALFALAERHEWNWWSRDTIGAIVQAGGFHDVIQVKTMSALKERGLVETEFNSWPEEIRRRVRCSCCCFAWGLTDAGRTEAAGLKIHWNAETLQKLTDAEWWDHGRHDMRRDEDEPPHGFGGFDDDDDDDSPRSPVPAGSPALVLT